jgi:histone deacetylase 6
VVITLPVSEEKGNFINLSRFCSYNHGAVAISNLLEINPKLKILSFDWDVHHGNGNQEIFYDNPNVLIMSIHRYDCGKFYPGEIGKIENVGEGSGEGYNVNIAFGQKNNSKGSKKTNEDYLYAFYQVCLPIIKEFEPDFIFIDSGYDSAKGDVMGDQNVTSECFGTITRELMKVNSKVVCFCNDGYSFDCIKPLKCVANTLIENDVPEVPSSTLSKNTKSEMMEIKKIFSKYWSSLN